MITRQQAALTAELIIEYPAHDPVNGWTLDVFAQGWLVCWHGRDPARFSIVIERETGLVRYFTRTPPQQILNNYDTVRHHGHPDHRWTAPRLACHLGTSPMPRRPSSPRYSMTPAPTTTSTTPHQQRRCGA